MLVTNGESKNYTSTEKNGATTDPRDHLPVPLRFLLKLTEKLMPTHIPVAIKLAVSIGIMLTLIMSLLGAVIIHNQTKLIRNQITIQGSTLVQTLAKSMGELITQAQMNDAPATAANPSGKTDPLIKQNLLLTLKVITTQITTNPEILGAVIYSAEGEILSNEGASPFNHKAPYAKKEGSFLDGNLRILPWKWKDPKKPNSQQLSAMSVISPIELQNTVVGHVLVTFNHDILDRSIQNSVHSIIIATLAMILLGIILSYLLGRRLTKPLYHLMDASQAIGRGNYSYRLPEHRNDEIGYLMTSFNAMAQGLYQKAQVEEAFSRHVSPTIAKEIIDNMSELNIGGKHVHASVLFVDIVGFTAMSESLPPEGVAQLLNEFYTNVGKVSGAFNGVVDKFMGDCAMVVFGISQDDEEHVYNSIACAICIQKLMQLLNEQRNKEGTFPVGFRIGVNTGEMLAGNMGSTERVQYTVVGDAVNLASRLCTAAPSDKIIITDETYNLAGLRRKVIASKYERMRIRGVKNPVNTYLVHDLQEPYSNKISSVIQSIFREKEIEKLEASNK